MSDASLQALRRAAATGGAEEHAALLRARLRAGELTRDGVELAAYAGSEVARLVLGDRYAGCMMGRICSCAYWPHVKTCEGCGECDGEDFCCLDEDLERWIAGLSRWPGALLRAAVAAAWVALVVWERTAPGQCDICGPRCNCRVGLVDLEPPPAPRRAIEAAEAWVVCPCERHRTAWERGWERSGCLFAPLPTSLGVRQDDGIAEAARVATPEAVRAAIQAELVPWALGERDPVAKRVQVKGGE